MKEKKGISPVIATVLLISMVVVIGLIIFLWFSTMVEETVLKFDQNIKLSCQDVDIGVEKAGNQISILNEGDIPIYRFEVEIIGDGYSETKNINDAVEGNKMQGGLNPGETYSANIEGNPSEINLYPVLIGEADSGKKAYVCEDQKFNVLL